MELRQPSTLEDKLHVTPLSSWRRQHRAPAASMLVLGLRPPLHLVASLDTPTPTQRSHVE